MAAFVDRQSVENSRCVRSTSPATQSLPDNSRGRSATTRVCGVGLALGIAVSFIAGPASAAEIAECRQMLLKGDYETCIQETHAALLKNRYGETWPLLKAQAECALGQYDTALKTISEGLRRYSWSIRLRWLARDAARRGGHEELSDIVLAEIRLLNEKFPWRYTDAEEIVILGRIDQLDGRDAREILDERFERAKLRSRTSREPWLAIGQLALDKNDSALAADTFRSALELFPDDPDFTFGLARTLESSDRQAASAGIQAVLQLNPKHLQSLFFQVETLISAEEYEAALQILDQAQSINSLEPEIWAYRAVIAHLTNDPRGEAAFRDKALARWSRNPRIDHLIGLKLSQHYRFQEGAEYQHRALSIDPNYPPAQRQLAQDLLRLGKETEGWEVANQAYEADSYNVATFNLLELHDELSGFTTLEDDAFTLRMQSNEAQLYGAETLELLHRAKDVLCANYGLDLKDRITVEIFPNEDDFAVRTFGMPAVSGYLGVCFGKVITANSPASRRENPSNWQAVLWHEFCHVVTLELTRNRIPRWLSEGISVYEELQVSSRWGQRMDPRSREYILEGGLTPLSELSSAFMRPESGWHLQFAYFESALAVEFLIENYGLDALKKVLGDLRAGLPINVALDRRCDSLQDLEARFDEFAKAKANALAPGLDWSKPDLQEILQAGQQAFEAWLKGHPNNFGGLMTLADQQLKQEQWDKAEETLKKLIDLYPTYTASGNAYERLASVYQATDRPEEERRVLEEFLTQSSDAVAASIRLIELQSSAEDWKAVEQTSASLFAIDPLLRQAHTSSAVAAERLGKIDIAERSLQRLLLLNPDDPADIHYRLASVLLQQNKPEPAKRHVLKALEEAPRYRDAHRLLLQIVRETSRQNSAVPGVPVTTTESEVAGPEPQDSKEGTTEKPAAR